MIPITFAILLYREAQKGFSELDINIPPKYIFLVIALLFLYLIWRFLLRGKTTGVRTRTVSSSIPWYKDWWIRQILNIIIFAVFAFGGWYLATKLKTISLKERVESVQQNTYENRLIPSRKKFMYAGVQYIWTRECATSYHFDLLQEGEAILTYRSKDYPENAYRFATINKEGYFSSEKISGKDPKVEGEYIVVSDRDATIRLREVKK